MAAPQSGYQATARTAGPGTRAPIFFENPDGSITEAVPTSLQDAASKAAAGGPRPGQSGGPLLSGDGSEARNGLSPADATAMAVEYDFLYSRHERVLLLLLAVQLALEILYDIVYVIRMESSVVELQAVYRVRTNVSTDTLEKILWTVFTLQVAYSSAFYVFAAVAIFTRRPKHYRAFANWTLAGIVMLILMAYVDKFNLLLFFLRLLSYIYARFLQGLTSSIVLLPPVP